MDEDIHICGRCRLEFHDLEKYVDHKRTGCSQRASDNTNKYSIQQTTDSSVELGSHVQAEISAPIETRETETLSIVLSESTEASTIDAVKVSNSNLDEKHNLALQGYKLISGGQVKHENELCDTELPNKLTVQIPGSDQVVMIDLSNSATILTNSTENISDSKDNIDRNVANNTLNEFLSLAQSTNHEIEEIKRDSDTPKLSPTMLATAGTDVITEAPKNYPTFYNDLGQRKFFCEYDQCKFTTSYARDLERHLRVHTGEKPFVCAVCDRAFNRADKLKIHLRGHTGEKPYQCSQCPYAAADSSSLKMHMRIHNNERPFKCQICPYASRNSSQLIVHLRTHTGDCPFQCQVCQAKFKINSDLKRHVRLHTGEKPFKCSVCDYKCAIKGNLKVHFKINHDRDNALKCPHCEFASSSKRMYREHLKCHDMKDRQVPCPRCDYRCLNHAALKAHLRSHSEDKPYECNYCHYSCKQSGNLKTHIKRKHHEKLMAIRVVAMKKAGLLKKNKGEDLSKVSLVNMLEGVNNSRGRKAEPVMQARLKPHKCPVCDAAFVREDSLKSHVRQHQQLEIEQKEMAQSLDPSTFSVLLPNHVVSSIGSFAEYEDASGERMEVVQTQGFAEMEESAELIEAREKAAAEEMLREIDASLGETKRRKAKGNRAERAGVLGKRGRPKGARTANGRSLKNPTKKARFTKKKGVRTIEEQEGAILFQQIPQQMNGEQHTLMTTNGQQIQIQAGAQTQQFFTVPKIMSPQQSTMPNIGGGEQNIHINQTNLMAFVQNNVPTRTMDDNMRNMTAQQNVVPITMTPIPAQTHTMEQMETPDAANLLQAQHAHNNTQPLDQQSNSLVAATSANNLQTGFLGTHTSSTHMTMTQTGTVFPQHTFIIPQATSTANSGVIIPQSSTSGSNNVFLPRAATVTQHTAQTVTANIQPIASQQYITPTHTTIQMPIQMELTPQHQQTQQQQHQQQQPQLLRLSTV